MTPEEKEKFALLPREEKLMMIATLQLQIKQVKVALEVTRDSIEECDSVCAQYEHRKDLKEHLQTLRMNQLTQRGLLAFGHETQQKNENLLRDMMAGLGLSASDAPLVPEAS